MLGLDVGVEQIVLREDTLAVVGVGVEFDRGVCLSPLGKHGLGPPLCTGMEFADS